MARKWTPAQTDAIEARRGSVLVSAAAGSGKTAVLVERVISRLTDTVKPTSADRLLIVTFTRAAAGEMKDRISAALSERLRKEPGNLHLINQQMLLPGAKICTIDSFCTSLVKENFSLLDISPDFKTADTGELTVLKRQAMDETMELMYQKGGNGFSTLVEMLLRGRDDSFLQSCIEKLYENSRSFPFPEKWLRDLQKPFENEVPLKESIYGKIMLSHIKNAVEYNLGIFENVLSHCMGDEELENVFYSAVSEDKAQCEYIISRINEGSWDETQRAVMAYTPKRRGNLPKHLKEDFFAKRLAAARKTASDNIRALAGFFCCSEQEFCEDMELFREPVKSLIDSVILFSGIYGRIKKEKKLCDFSDITHLALSLLVKATDDGWESTEFAKIYSESFDEILIDEYQDTNRAQDMLFTAISRNNLFRVGDVKQSIYSFRQAMPQIFLEIKSAYESYNRNEDKYPAKIILGNNFRSRKGVTDIINFIFRQIMSEESGDIEYNDEEQLVFSAAYDEKHEPDCELHVLDTGTLDTENETNHEFQARYIARRIKAMLSQGYTVRQGDTERKATYKDFCLLLRSVSTKAAIYADVFRREGVPCFTEVTGSFLTAEEISLTLNILRIIDNPKQDVALLSVMMSPIFGFTVDEVSLLRRGRRKGDIYSCILEMAEENNEKINYFLHKISLWRNLSICLCTSELINEIYDDTGLVSIFDAMDPSGEKRANLMLLLDYASSYEKAGYIGLSGFIRFVDRLKNEKQDLSAALGVVQNADVVKIMTIHKSKGLEFPVCILGNCAGLFNRMDEAENLVVNRNVGLGLIRRDTESFDQFETLCHSAVKLSIHHDSLSEELRVLYVAMTRAREKLIMVYGGKNPLGAIERYSLDINDSRSTISPYAVGSASSFGRWILTSLLRHKDAVELREKIGMDESIVLPCESPLKVVFSEADNENAPEEEKQVSKEIDEDFLAFIKQRADFRYKYEALSGVISKRAASEVDRGYIDRDYFASSAPAFLSEGGLTGAGRGIATHTFIQFADYEKAKADLECEIERLHDLGILSDAQCKGINRRAVARFFQSELADRILSSENVMREKKFTIEIPVNEIYEGLDEFSDEMMMIQGIADCAFVENGEIVVVDYKTDSLDSEDKFREKYASQVLLYKKALAECIGLPVKQTLLYSFHLGKEIEVE
ncbi:MAG: helicase-exonuclease AddAB subunit AddA [Clostridia bacterium]|nr:helicase-exonuclease AddAB subunit AddA [Clostridia bacterium]